MSHSITIAASALGQASTPQINLKGLLQTVLEGSFGSDWQERSRIVIALSSVRQGQGALGEELLLRELNENLNRVNSGYRIRVGLVQTAEPAHRALEIADVRLNCVVDRMTFVF